MDGRTSASAAATGGGGGGGLSARLEKELERTLREFVRMKTVSSDPSLREDCFRGAKYLAHLLESLGTIQGSFQCTKLPCRHTRYGFMNVPALSYNIRIGLRLCVCCAFFEKLVVTLSVVPHIVSLCHSLFTMGHRAMLMVTVDMHPILLASHD